MMIKLLFLKLNRKSGLIALDLLMKEIYLLMVVFCGGGQLNPTFLVSSGNKRFYRGNSVSRSNWKDSLFSLRTMISGVCLDVSDVSTFVFALKMNL